MKGWAACAVLGVAVSSARGIEAETYRVVVTSASIDVDGELNEPGWNEAEPELGFGFPWQEREPPATEFRALADDVRLYFAFRVEDSDIVIGEGEDERAVARGDRVELFFTPDLSLHAYICFEIDPDARVLDYRASFYRDFDFDWDLPEMEVASSRTETGYVVEGSLPLAALPGEGRILTGIFRAEYTRRRPAASPMRTHADESGYGGQAHHGGEAPKTEWISWVSPDSDEPDFHIPSAFGWLEIR